MMCSAVNTTVRPVGITVFDDFFAKFADDAEFKERQMAAGTVYESVTKRRIYFAKDTDFVQAGLLGATEEDRLWQVQPVSKDTSGAVLYEVDTDEITMMMKSGMALIEDFSNITSKVREIIRKKLE